MRGFLILGFSVIVLALASCTDDPCNNRGCGKHGSCVSVGEAFICECETGWEQDANGRCEFYKLDNFPGNYTATETCTNDLTSDEVNRSYNLTISILSQLNREIALAGINKQSCGSQALEVEAVVSNTSFAFKTGNYCEQNDAVFVFSEGEGELENDGSYSLNYKVQYYEFGTILRSETCQVTLN